MTKRVHFCNFCGHCDINDEWELWRLSEEAVKFLVYKGEVEVEDDEIFYDFHVCDKCAKRLAKTYPENFKYYKDEYCESFEFID